MTLHFDIHVVRKPLVNNSFQKLRYTLITVVQSQPAHGLVRIARYAVQISTPTLTWSSLLYLCLSLHVA